jgi:hypothetical protein
MAAVIEDEAYGRTPVAFQMAFLFRAHTKTKGHWFHAPLDLVVLCQAL